MVLGSFFFPEYNKFLFFIVVCLVTSTLPKANQKANKNCDLHILGRGWLALLVVQPPSVCPFNKEHAIPLKKLMSLFEWKAPGGGDLKQSST